MISIITPVYNAERTLSDYIATLQAQTVVDWEAIFINDGSTDKSEKLLYDFAASDPRIRVFSQSNAGPAAARNAAMLQMKGEWFTFVDADDLLPPHYLEQLIAAAETENCALVLCDVRLMRGETVLAHHHNQNGVYTSKEYAKAVLARDVDYLTAHGACAKLFRSDLVRDAALKMDCRFRRGEDAIFSRQYAAMLPQAATVCVTNATWYEYCEQEASLTTRYLETIPASQGALARAAQVLYQKCETDPAAQGALDQEQYLNFAWTVQTLQSANLPLGKTILQLKAILNERILTPEELMRVKGGGRAWKILARILHWRNASVFWLWLHLRSL